jgi:hypothetical protein
MLYRAAAFAIVAFWLVMMGLLVRLETHPEATDILDVPVSYVMRIMFKHGQESLLTVSDGTRPVGSVALRPVTSGSDGRSLDFSGTMSVPQRFSFSGAMNMDAALRMRDFRLDASIFKPRYTLKAVGDTARNRLAYEVRLDGLLTASQSLPMDPASLGPALAQNLGLDPHSLPIAAATGVSPPAIAAREAKVTLRGEQIEVYEVTVAEGTVPLITLDVTQLGQIILAKTGFGYTLSAEDWQ